MDKQRSLKLSILKRTSLGWVRILAIWSHKQIMYARVHANAKLKCSTYKFLRGQRAILTIVHSCLIH
jgi:hypothetical protein